MSTIRVFDITSLRKIRDITTGVYICLLFIIHINKVFSVFKGSEEVFRMRVLELYSGIGGMHYALKESNVEGEVVLSIDVNTVANEVYKHNFPKTSNISRNIQSLSIEEIRKLNIDTILMSPPCQPFTRVGLKKDTLDNRSASLFHILKLIPQIETLKFILVENVKGFETSETRNELVTCLENKFNYKEFLLSPCQFGVPNSRHRCYILAKRKDLDFCFKDSTLVNSLPENIFRILPDSRHMLLASKEGFLNPRTDVKCYKLSHIIQEVVEEQYLISEKILQKYASILDIRNEDANGSCCFTKAYGHYVEGTGSVFCPYPDNVINKSFSKLKSYQEVPLEEFKSLVGLKLRYFTPKEVSRLMCFPEEFSFPNTVTNKQRYRLLGNSINVHVISQLIFLLNHEKIES